MMRSGSCEIQSGKQIEPNYPRTSDYSLNSKLFNVEIIYKKPPKAQASKAVYISISSISGRSVAL